MEKRVTIKDIAREAGVSVATVSYVLNNRQNQKISQATRSRVLQIAGVMGYTGTKASNPPARNGRIALCSCAENGTLLQADHMELIQALTRALEGLGYAALLFSPDRCEKIAGSDAIICIDAEEDFCHRLVLRNSVPVLGLNVVSESPLSAQVNADYSEVMRRAQEAFGFDFCVVTCDVPNAALHRRIESACGSDVYFCRTAADLLEFLPVNGSRPLAVTSPAAYGICTAVGVRAELIQPDAEKLAARVCESARLAALRHAIEQNDAVVF